MQQLQPATHWQVQSSPHNGQPSQHPPARLTGREASATSGNAERAVVDNSNSDSPTKQQLPPVVQAAFTEQARVDAPAVPADAALQHGQAQASQVHAPPAQHWQPLAQAHPLSSPQSGHPSQHALRVVERLGVEADITIPAADRLTRDVKTISLENMTLSLRTVRFMWKRTR